MNHTLFDLIDENLDITSLSQLLKTHGTVNAYIPEGVLPFVLSALSRQGNILAITKDEFSSEVLFEALKEICPERVLLFPELDVIPYTNVFPSLDKLADRMNTLFRLFNQPQAHIIIVTIESFLRKIPSKELFGESVISLRQGHSVDLNELSRSLVSLSYRREYKVTYQGNFSIRGDIIDIYPPHYKDPVRISLFGQKIESIRLYDPISQRSIGNLEEADIIPASEFAIALKNVPELSENENQPSLHSTFIRYCKSFSSVVDYFPSPPLIVYPEKAQEWANEINDKYRTYTPAQWEWGDLLFSFENLLPPKRIVLTGSIGTDIASVNAVPITKKAEGFSGFFAHLDDFFSQHPDNRVFILVEYDNLAKRLLKILKKYQPKFSRVDQSLSDSRLNILLSGIEKGFELRLPNGSAWQIVSESDFTGKKRLFRKRVRQIDSLFEDIDQIKEGEYVVHLNYGIGVFRGLERINVLGKAKDYVVIEYADNEKLYVPLEQTNLIGKYVGSGNQKPRLDSLGSRSWAKKRERVAKSIQEFALRLLKIYAQRTVRQGYKFSADSLWQQNFEDQFDFIETPDQVKVLNEIKRDMESVHPMDRLLCGDVGFGKTEVAMRAAFKAVMDGKQVALIAPTTVLVEQHYYTFLKRFKGFPVRIEYISRFTPDKQLKRIIAELETHKIDIIIGTHKLFSPKLNFHILGLVIIDEEHKFGVEQKERLKERYPSADFLSLSATPIPRTLSMAMSDLRDISLLQTPPDMRIPVQTTVSDYSPEIVKYAIEKELDRGGQVFFVHNSIKRLSEYAFMIEKLVPRAKVAIGHGQMDEAQLDEAFMGFVRGHYNVFVSTTIIDSGLDIPNANTIIISDAQRYGLSQLYQLKGRVGRSNREGYAYFLYPVKKMLTENAQKRLFVISEYTDLGAGFQVAMKDLEIRGAGNILGREQHGNIVAVGYDVYMRLLKEQVQKLRGEWHEEVITMIDLNYSAYIPEKYITEPTARMEVYKKIASVRNEDEIRQLIEEISDRFGRIPVEVATLFEISRMKIKASRMGIESLIEKDKFIEISFSKYSKVDPKKVINILKLQTHPIKVMPQHKHKIFYEKFDADIGAKVRRLTKFLDEVKE